MIDVAAALVWFRVRNKQARISVASPLPTITCTRSHNNILPAHCIARCMRSSMTMEVARIESMTMQDSLQSLKTAQLELVYERALRQSERIYEEERIRALRVQMLLLEDDNDELQEQLGNTEGQLEKLEDQQDGLNDALVQTEADLQRAQTDLKSRMRDIDYYRTELNSLTSMSADSTKMLTEKLALSRELAILKPELDHLKSQTASQQNLLAEKLALQRELSTLQVELETEKRAVQRTKAKDNNSKEDDPRLASKIEELQKEIAKEKREAQKGERDARKQAADWEGQKTILESKLDAFRNKLRTTKEQLKETQIELEQAQAAKTTRQEEFAAAKPATANPRKRPIARFDPDATIGTPGHDSAAKKARTSMALPGDKSTFSITPFLNRTMSLAPDSPSEDVHEKVDKTINAQIDAIMAENEDSPPKPAAKAKPAKKAIASTAGKAKGAQALKDSTVPKANVNIPKPRAAAAPAKAMLDSVMEEGNENEESTEQPPALPNITKNPPIKKKQKLLGQRKSLFDDADDDAIPKSKLGIGFSKGTGLRGGAVFGAISLAGKGKTLAEFSPLKKDRRAAAAVAGA